MRKHNQSPAVKENQITENCLLDISKDGYWMLFYIGLNSYKKRNKKLYNDEPIPKTNFYFHIDKSLRIIFMIGNSICHLEFENLEDAILEFWDRLNKKELRDKLHPKSFLHHFLNTEFPAPKAF